MNADDTNARKSILLLLCDLPNAVKNTYYTSNELAKLLVKGGVSSSIDGAGPGQQ